MRSRALSIFSSATRMSAGCPLSANSRSTRCARISSSSSKARWLDSGIERGLPKNASHRTACWPRQRHRDELERTRGNPLFRRYMPDASSAPPPLHRVVLQVVPTDHVGHATPGSRHAATTSALNCALCRGRDFSLTSMNVHQKLDEHHGHRRDTSLHEVDKSDAHARQSDRHARRADQEVRNRCVRGDCDACSDDPPADLRPILKTEIGFDVTTNVTSWNRRRVARYSIANLI